MHDEQQKLLANTITKNKVARQIIVYALYLKPLAGFLLRRPVVIRGHKNKSKTSYCQKESFLSSTVLFMSVRLIKLYYQS